MADWHRQVPAEGGQHTNIITAVNVHLHCETARKATTGTGGRAAALKNFWNELALCAVKHKPMILAGDFNMSLFMVVPELRARGIQVTTASWYPYKAPKKNTHNGAVYTQVDSCGIWLFGNTPDPIRLVYPPSILGEACIKLDPSEEDCKALARV